MKLAPFVPGLINAAADLLIHALKEEGAIDKIGERAAILAARGMADEKARKKFSTKK